MLRISHWGSDKLKGRQGWTDFVGQGNFGGELITRDEAALDTEPYTA